MEASEFVETLQEFGVTEPDALRYFKAFDLNDSGVVDYRCRP